MIVRLSAQTPETLAVLGGKGCGLVRLLRAGLPVPEAWCLPATAYEPKDGSLPRGVELALGALWEEIAADAQNPPLLAVRSSATAEDLDEASFAGVYQTLLGVAGADALVDAVAQCWAALNTEGARAYRRERGIGGKMAIALVIQRMVRADVAGVLLTANPLRPFAGEMVIDASWGLGEAVVSGLAQPDHWVLDRESGTVREHHLGTKETHVVLQEGGGTAQGPVKEDRRGRPCLSQGQIGRLFDLARRVERAIGPRQDLEWAFEQGALYVLQQRPITGLPPERPGTIWTRKFGDEYLADYTFPLSHGLLVRWISEDYFKDVARLMDRPDLAALEPLRRYQGYAYMNGEYVARMLRAVPPASRAQDTLGWFPPQWGERARAQPFEPRRLLGIVRAMASDRRAPIGRNEAALAAHCRRIEARIVPRLSQDYSALSAAEWRRQFDEAYEMGREHFRVIRWGMGFHSPLLHGLSRELLRRWAGDEGGALYQAVISGLPGTRTAEINRDIWRLGQAARADEGVREWLLGGCEDWQEVRAATSASLFWEKFDGFLQRHGHRAATREIAHPRWRETPELVLALVRAQLGTTEPPPDPGAVEALAVKKRKQAERTALSRVGPLRRLVLQRVLLLTQRYTRYRENQRYHLDYLLLHLRQLLLEQGRRLAGAGVLEDPAEVFFLDASEFWPLVDRPIPSLEIRARLAERRRHYLQWKDRLPATYLYDDVETEGEEAEDDLGPGESGAGGDGMGASRGAARGRVRVVRHLGEIAGVEPGEILVASNIDPGWTSVFPLLAGLVTETGGILSHGALLAREYGIPAVMGVAGATHRFVTGEILEIDGSRGSVRVVE